MSVDLRVDWCSYEAAKYAVLNWHYSKRVPHASQQYIGAWETGKFIGVVWFGRSITPWLGNPYGLTQHECAELTRVALTNHIAPVSKIVSSAIGLVKRKNPKLRLLVSYADPAQGHNGSIYQAMNWIYDGVAVGRRQWLYDGEWRNDVYIFKMSKSIRDKLPSRVVMPKHRYLYPLDRAMRKQIAPLAKPYPKRETCGQSVEGDTVDDQSTEIGSIPIARFE